MKRKLSVDGWLFIAILVLIVIIIIEAVIISTKVKGQEQVVEEDTESYFVLYKGCEIAIDPGNQNPLDFSVDLDETSEKRYNTTYYNYEKGLYKGETEGTFKFEDGGYNEVENVSKIAMTKKFNAIPRAFERLDKVPEEIKDDLEEYDNISADLIDIDGDGTKEYFVCVQDLRTEDSEPVAYSAIMLYSHDYAKISDLVVIEDGVFNDAKKKTTKTLDDEDYVFIDLDRIEYIDLNDDNIMEVLIDVPQWEEMMLSIFDYSAYEVIGEQVVIESINP